MHQEEVLATPPVGPHRRNTREAMAMTTKEQTLPAVWANTRNSAHALCLFPRTLEERRRLLRPLWVQLGVRTCRHPSVICLNSTNQKSITCTARYLDGLERILAKALMADNKPVIVPEVSRLLSGSGYRKQKTQKNATVIVPEVSRLLSGSGYRKQKTQKNATERYVAVVKKKRRPMECKKANVNETVNFMVDLEVKEGRARA
ncbi:hypothetical protein NDU88_001359 [Pleurodeles waltl]|uniref:Uncharacterized protein n=1 Tax=Pleurodeles waltl TaxID=8319 RepID=A0AAV7MKS8_PLEWA|nr:hypothetical protein NDU88_001359 [Pleurodeles waltl]